MLEQQYEMPAAAGKVSPVKWWLWVPVGAVLAFLLFGAIVGNSPEAKERSRQKEIIDRCWEVQGRKSLEPGVQRAAAGMCEGLEREYEQKFGRRP